MHLICIHNPYGETVSGPKEGKNEEKTSKSKFCALHLSEGKLERLFLILTLT